MSKKYYATFPSAPVELVASLAAAAQIPSIVDAHVSADNSVMLDIKQDPDSHDGFSLTAAHLAAIADACGVDLGDVYVEPGEDGAVSVSVWATKFDFGALFRGTQWEGSICKPRLEMVQEGLANLAEDLQELVGQYKELPGVKDSEESIAASAALITQK